MIQGGPVTALGGGGSGLGYEGIGNSVAVKFDLFDNAGEGGNSTGLYTDGRSPTTAGIDLTPTNIDLHSGHHFRVSVGYAAGTLRVALRDLATGATASQSYAVDIPGLVGAPTAFVGFTAGTGSLSATQVVLNWAYWE